MSAHEAPAEGANKSKDAKRSKKGKILKYAAVVLAAVPLLAVALCVGVTLWLTPPRLTALINREGSQYLNADVRVYNARFTFWSSFPHLHIEADSASVRSRVFDHITQAQRDSLPEDAERLMSAGAMAGGIDIFDLLRGRVSLGMMKVSDLSLNLVTLSDTLSNFNILPRSADPHQRLMPISAQRISLLSPRIMRYRNIAAATDATLQLHRAVISRIAGNTYDMNLRGRTSVSASGMRILQDFPFLFDGKIRMHFNPLGVRFFDYKVNLGNLKGTVNFDMNLDEKGGGAINRLNIDLNSLDLLDLLDYLPLASLPDLSDIRAQVGMGISARLMRPYSFSDATLPPIQVDFNISPGSVSYIAPQRVWTLEHSSIDARFDFDGANPAASTFEIFPFEVTAPGMEYRIAADVSRLTTNPHFDVNVSGTGELSVLPTLLKDKTLHSFGTLTTDAQVNFDLDDVSGAPAGTLLDNIRISGKADVRNLKVLMGERRSPRLYAAARAVDLTFSGGVSDMSLSALSAAAISSGVTLDSVAFMMDGARVECSRLAVKSGMHISDESPLRLKAQAEKVRIGLPEDIDGHPQGSIVVDVAGMRMNGMAGASLRTLAAGIYKNISLSINADDVAVRLPDGRVSLKNIQARLSDRAQQMPHAVSVAEDARWADSLSLSRIKHTPVVLQVRPTARLLEVMRAYPLSLDLQAERGSVHTRAFPVSNMLDTLSLSATFDTVAIHEMRLRTQSTSMRLQGGVGNLREFVSSSHPAPLRVSLNADIDTLNINQLARAYQRGQVLLYGKDVLTRPVTATAADSVTLLLPRNLEADIHATAREIHYMNLVLTDLHTDIGMRGGVADVHHLLMKSDFGDADMRLKFDTSDMQRIGVEAFFSMKDISVQEFLASFPSVRAMAPEMSNLHGVFAVEGDASLLVYPNMSLNIPSLRADLGVQGRDIDIHQSPFIHKILRMLFIDTHRNVRVDDINVQARVYDNLLELYPFRFIFDRYRLQLQGLNNFAGDMYYHLAVERWPLLIPFSVNIEGNFSKPHLRFGGEGFDEKRSMEISENISSDIHINMVRQMRRGSRAFINSAAQSPSD